jgi:O-antigen ligase
MNPLSHDTTENKISALLLLLFAISLPFDRFYSELLLIVLVAHTAIHLRTRRWKGLRVGALTAHSAAFLLTIMATAWDSNPGAAFGRWELQLSLLLLPFALFLLEVDLARYRPLIIDGFIGINTLVAAYLFADALRTIHFYGQPLHDLFSSAFLGHNFSAPLDIHATYLSLYFALSLTGALQQLLRGESTLIKRTLLVGAALLLAAGLIQLASRAVLVMQVAVALLVLPFELRSPKTRAAWFASIAVAGTAAWLIVRHNPFLYQRLVTDLAMDLSGSRDIGAVADPRGSRWKLALDILRKAPLFGHGSGSEQTLLRAAYFEHGLYDSFLNRLNAHNQYLSIAIRSGLAGLLAWSASLCYFLRQSWRERDGLLAAFLLLFLGTALSENLLDVNKGLFFFAFFLAILGLRRKKTALQSRESNPKAASAVFISEPRKQTAP